MPPGMGASRTMHAWFSHSVFPFPAIEFDERATFVGGLSVGAIVGVEFAVSLTFPTS
jgi:hypothetical protein